MKFTILLDTSLVIISINVVFSLYEPSPGEEKIFKEIHQFYTFYPKITSPLGGGHEIYNFMSPYHTDATYLVWLRLVGRS